MTKFNFERTKKLAYNKDNKNARMAKASAKAICSPAKDAATKLAEFLRIYYNDKIDNYSLHIILPVKSAMILLLPEELLGE